MRGRWMTWTLLAGAAVLAAGILAPTPVYSHKPITTNILFKNEIAQIFQRKCFQCHTPNNLSFSFITYTDARPWARAIREEILERRMPPWTAVRGYGHFANDLSLTAREMEIILSWADGGAPSGVLKVEESIPPVYTAPAPEWTLGPPDVVLPIGDGQAIDAGAPFSLRRFVVAPKLDVSARLRSMALKQGDRRVVRYAAFYEEPTGRWLGSWTPWQTASSLPDGHALRLAPGARLAVEIGYSGADEAVTDRSELGLYFDKGSGPLVDAMKIAAPAAALAAGAGAHRVRTEMTIASAIEAVALWPSPSDSARSIEVTMTTPEGVSTPLLWIKDYRPEWRSAYDLAPPVALPRGTKLAMTTYFDNPADQPVTATAEAWLLTTKPPASSSQAR